MDKSKYSIARSLLRFDEPWDMLTAITNIYVRPYLWTPDGGTLGKPHLCATLEKIARECVEGRQSYGCHPELEGVVNTLLVVCHRIETVTSTAVRSGKYHALTWMRLAVLHGRSVPQLCFIEFAEWRQTYGSNILLARHEGATKSGGVRLRGPTRTWSVHGVADGYTIEELVFGELAGIQHPWQRCWHISSGGSDDSPSRAKQGSVRNIRLTLSVSPSEKSVGQLRHVRRANAVKVCGEGPVAALEDFFKNARRKGALISLSSPSPDGRYVCNVTRDALVSIVQKRSADLAQYSPATIARALSAIVQCPRGCPGGRRTLRA